MIAPAKLRQMVGQALGTPVDVADADVFPSPIVQGDSKRWTRLLDVFVVAADLKNSTRLGTGKYVNSTVRIYCAATGVGVELLDSFSPNFVDIQGDGFFGIFHGDGAGRRAIAAAMMLAHFSKYQLEPAIREQIGTGCPKTGLKIGVADGRVAVAPLGVREYARPVWAGKPVNWASKCSEAASAHQVIVTAHIFDSIIRSNDFLKQPCYHPGHPKEGLFGHLDGSMWRSIPVPGLPSTVKCAARDVPWCDGNGKDAETASQFCESVINGERDRKVSWWKRNGS